MFDFKVLSFKIRNLPYLMRSWLVPLGAKAGAALGSMTVYGKLEAAVIDADGTRHNLGTVGYRVITNSGVGYLAAAFAAFGGALASDFKYHGSGTGTGAESSLNTALGSEVTDSARPAGSVLSLSGGIYRTIGTISYTSSHAITEHGIFNQSTVLGSTLWDRTVFAAINVVNGQSLQFAYQLTISSGG